MSDIRVHDVQCAQYAIEIVIRSTSTQVWHALFADINQWWLPDFHMLGGESVVSFEPKAGGQLVERTGERELVWYSVIAVDPETLVTVVGHCTGEFGGPSTSILTLRLSTQGDVTVLTITDELIGKNSAAQAASLRDGWAQLFSDGLKCWIESR